MESGTLICLPAQYPLLRGVALASGPTFCNFLAQFLLSWAAAIAFRGRLLASAGKAIAPVGLEHPQEDKM